MPLKLVIGPANAAKARVVLEAHRADAARDPILVVPTFADVERYRRELADGGLVFGARVLRFKWLFDELAARAGVPAQPLGPLARERVAGAAIAGASLRVLRRAADTPGFARSFLKLVDELEERRITPGRFRQALRVWAEAEGPGRVDQAEDLGALYGAYRNRLEALRRLDVPLHRLAVVDALAQNPERWGRTPVSLYGFDDFTPPQLRAIETLAGPCDADVTVSLPYEDGRDAFVGRAATVAALRALAGTDNIEALPARTEHYEPAARTALHHLERNLFGAADGRDGGRVPAGDALLLLEGGGERAELELVGAHVARLLREGVAPGEVAIVLRRPADHAALLSEVLGSYEIPYALDRRVPAGHTALGRGLLGLLRCALLPDATADDLLAWLRTPGFLRLPGLVDALEREIRRAGVTDLPAARARFEQRHFPLDAIDELARAARRGPVALCERLEYEVARLFANPFRRGAIVLEGAQRDDARVAAALAAGLRELRELVAADAALLPAPDVLIRTLAGIDVFVGDPGGPGSVSVADPLNVRARRVRALFVCGLQEGTFPATGAPDAFLGDVERRAINVASGLGLPLREDRLARERSLFYAAASRPTEVLALSWRMADDDGNPAVRSLFVDDVVDLFEPDLLSRVQSRELGAAGWDGELAPTDREARRAQIAAAPRPAPPIAALEDPAVLETLRAREAWSASALETWVSCPVRWFVERLLRVEDFTTRPEAMVRGELAHRALEETLRALIEHHGSGPLRPAQLGAAKARLREALTHLAPEYALSANPERQRATLRRLETDLIRYLEHAVAAGSEFAPSELELCFGGSADERPPVEVGEHGLRLTGRIDRVDVGPGDEAIVYDYKGASAVPHAAWGREGNLQVALYMLALPGLLGRTAAGGFYQPLNKPSDARPRGLLRADADPGLNVVRNDRVSQADFDDVLGGALAVAEQAVEEIHRGALEPRPATCGWQGGGCRYPSICRCEST